jgi:enolase-phosphatase E1
VTITLADRSVRLVLLDIEGTTTPIAFVSGTLFPFARRHIPGWVESHAGSEQGRLVAARLAAEYEADRAGGERVPPWPDDAEASSAGLIAYADWLMHRDRKSTGLKLLQGLVWEEGYQAGVLHGEVYEDVPRALRRWRDARIDVAIYSSGSELAQRRLFASTGHGDLTPLVVGFFDTTVGAKHEVSSYTRIASSLNHRPDHVLFVSDVDRELAAARAAGCQTVLSLRPGNPPQPGADRFEQVKSFDELV